MWTLKNGFWIAPLAGLSRMTIHIELAIARYAQRVFAPS
jgi:hypothetical protein